MKVSTTNALAAVFLPLLALLSAGADAAPAPAGADVSGLWRGTLMYQPAQLEVGVYVELARDPLGKWVGTIDLPNQRMKFFPLGNVKVEGSTVYWEFNRFAQKAGVWVNTPFTGTIEANGEIAGDFFEGGRDHVPLRLARIGEAGSERPEAAAAKVYSLSDDGAELKARFNQDSGKVRLLILLSPT